MSEGNRIKSQASSDPIVLFEAYKLEKVNLEGRRPATMNKYGTAFRLFLATIGDLPLREVGPQEISEFVGACRGRAPTTVAYYLNCLSSFFHWLRKRKHISDDPFEDFVRKTPEKPPPDGIRWSEAMTAIENVEGDLYSPRDRALLLVLAFTGGRIGEVLARSIDDFDVEEGKMTFTNTKGRRARIVYPPSEVTEHLREYKKWLAAVFPDSPWLFPSRGGKRLRAPDARAALRRYGIKATPKQFRTAFATEQLKRNGGNIALVQKLLGHASPATTVRYLLIHDEDLKRAGQNLSSEFTQEVTWRGRVKQDRRPSI